MPMLPPVIAATFPLVQFHQILPLIANARDYERGEWGRWLLDFSILYDGGWVRRSTPLCPAGHLPFRGEISDFTLATLLATLAIGEICRDS